MNIIKQLNAEALKVEGNYRRSGKRVYKGELNGESVILKQGGEELFRERYILEQIQRKTESAFTPRPLGIYREGGHTYLLQTRFTGEPLGSYIGLNERWESRPLDIAEALPIVRFLAIAFSHVHKAGFIYQDLNLNHIIYDPRQGNIIGLVDLEACSISAIDGKHYNQKSRGTWATMAPEEFEACLGEELTPTANIYSLGIVTLQLLCGQFPLNARHFLPRFARITKELQGRLHAEQNVDTAEFINNPDLAKVIQKAISKKPEERYQTADAFLKALGV